MAKKHWTQTAAGKAKLRRGMKASWRKRKNRNRAKQGVEWLTGNDRQRARAAVTPVAAGAKRGLPKDEIVALAKEAARARITALEQEIVKLRIFVGDL